MEGKRIKQINNLVISLSKDGQYKVWSPVGNVFYASYELSDAVEKCKGCTQFLKKSKSNNRVDNGIATKLIHHTGGALRSYIESFGALRLNKRDFVGCVTHYIKKSKSNRVLAISGLRGTGKTTGILQALYLVGNLDDTVFISVTENNSIGIDELHSFIDRNYSDKKVIVIDEVTNADGFIKGVAFLSDKYCSSGKRVIVSGTDSLAIELSAWDSLYHRVINKNITFISYSEASRILGISLSEYLDFGGLFEADRLTDVDDAHNYVQTALIDNIYNTLRKNVGATSLLSIADMDALSIRTVVFKILYSIVYSNIDTEVDIDFNLIIHQFNNKQVKKYGVDVINEVLRQSFGIVEHTTVRVEQIKTILKFMINTGIIVEARNIANAKPCSKYYITNPSLYNQLALSIKGIMQEEGFRSNNRKSNMTYRDLFEAAVMTHSIIYAKAEGLKVYFYRDSDSREIDLVFEKEHISKYELKKSYAFYEIKLNSQSDIVASRIKWLNNPDVVKYIKDKGRLVGHGVIYTGNSKEFNGYENRETLNKILKHSNNSKDALKLEQQNKGTKFVSAEQYLKDPGSILGKLVNM